jgi:hypothetical protein
MVDTTLLKMTIVRGMRDVRGGGCGREKRREKEAQIHTHTDARCV